MAWSGQFSDFDNFVLPNARGNIQDSKPRSTKPHNIQKESDKSNIRLEDINLGYSSIVNVVGIILSKEEARSVQSRKSSITDDILYQLLFFELNDCSKSGAGGSSCRLAPVRLFCTRYNPLFLITFSNFAGTFADSGTERFVFNFTLRDAPLFYVNVTFWGNGQYIKDLTDRFHIGDIVSLSNVQVQAKPQDGSDEKYRSVTPVLFSISGSENHSNIDWYNGPDNDTLTHLQHFPVKATNDFYTLEDILANGQGLHGDHVNILCVLRKIGQVKDITTKAGRHTHRCELRILDETCPSFSLVLWDKELIILACTWMPLETVIFAADVKITYDDYRSTMIATADSKTIVTVNPDTLEAQSLYQFAHSQDFQESDENSTNKTDPSLDSITDLYNIYQIKQLLGNLSDQWKPTQYGVAYVFLTQFNIDSEGSGALRYRCQKCRGTVFEERGFMCTNVECIQGALGMFDSSVIDIQPFIEYAVPVSISDHTGTLDHCFLDGDVVESLLRMKAEVYKGMEIDKKTQLKWTFLLERCKIYFKIFKSNGSGGNENKGVFKIMSLEQAHLKDVGLSYVNEQ